MSSRKRPRGGILKEEERKKVYGACQDVDEFHILCEIGRGTYGTVFKATENATGRAVALKRVILHNEKAEGFPITSLREVKLLRRTQHDNVVALRGVAVGRKREDVYLVFEYCRHDLSALIDGQRGPRAAGSRSPFSLPEVKCLAQQLLRGVAHLHRRWCVHRDLKMSNLLYDCGRLKIADFGLARECGRPAGPMTPRVVTQWYRPPEVLLGSRHYGLSVDLWSAGCIIAELATGRVLFHARDEAGQLPAIVQVLGAPTDATWPGWRRLPGAAAVDRAALGYVRNRLGEAVPEAVLGADGLDLLGALLAYDPAKRPTAEEALAHPFFSSTPLPLAEVMMPSFPSAHDAAVEDARRAEAERRRVRAQRGMTGRGL